MSYKWQGTSESGILRRNDTKEKLEELLVFGYACKLFRDDEKALFIDQGKHLIPWMGDEKLKIDRYDGRGALSELSSCEASREGYDAMRWLGLSDAERRLEQLCDEERYYSLHINEEEEELYKEEELKRIAQKGKEVGYNYEAPTVAAESSENSQGPSLPSEGEEEEELYVPPPELDVPINVTLPKTAKQNARIEKTALFISKQGPQMEILLKAKQKDNVQFSFMNSDDTLYRYYRHVLMAIKAGHYRSISEQVIKEEAKEDGEDGAMKNETDDHYLHPSLIKTAPVLVESAPPLAALPFKPSANCAYSQLVNRIQNNNQPVQQQQQHPEHQQHYPLPVPAAPAAASTAAGPIPAHNSQQQQLTLEQQQYYQQQYYAQYYEYYRQNGYYPQGYPQPQTQQQIEQMYSMQQQQQQQKPADPSNPYAQIVSNVAPMQMTAAPPSQTAAALAPPQQQQQSSLITGAPVLYGANGSGQSAAAAVAVSATAAPAPAAPAKPHATHKAPLLSLAQYGSETDSEDDTNDGQDGAGDGQESGFAFVTPPVDTQLIIDKMASYVAKNGTDFEAIVKSKGDPRFVFLNPDHEHHGYYKYKIGVYTNFTKKSAQDSATKADDSPNGNSANAQQGAEDSRKIIIKEKKVIAPVCFSIKKAKESEPTIEKSALPVEESDEEENGTDAAAAAKDSSAAVATSAPPPAIPTSEASSSSSASESNPNSSNAPTTTTTVAAVTSTNAATTNSLCGGGGADKTANVVVAAVAAADKENSGKNASKAAAAAADGSEQRDVKIAPSEDPLMELIDLTDDLEERRDAKRAEDRLKDKIAAAAREKLSSSSRDKALQLERKRRAAAFLSQLKTSKPSERSHQETKEREVKRIKTDSDSVCGKAADAERDTRHSDTDEEGEIKSGSSSKHQKSSRKKKSHKRKRSKSKHEKKDHKRDKEHKKSKRRRRRNSSSSCDSDR